MKYSTADLVARSAGELRGMPEIKSPFIRVDKGEVQMDKKGVVIQAHTTLPCRAWVLEPQPELPARDARGGRAYTSAIGCCA